jgi:hypothetical protein
MIDQFDSLVFEVISQVILSNEFILYDKEASLLPALLANRAGSI